MLDVTQILSQYPTSLQPFSRLIIKEYLQCKILQLIYQSAYASKLVFLGGTCLRIVHDNQRFSEDLDFDNTGLAETEFVKLAEVVADGLRLEGYEVELRLVMSAAYHCYIKFSELLYKSGLSSHQEEKILIQLDTEPQRFNFKPQLFLLNRFDVFTQIYTTPGNLLLAQKFYAILNRNRNKGRDFYDVVFLLGKQMKPDYNYLQQKTGIASGNELRSHIISHLQTLNMQLMADDVKPFLFKNTDDRKVLLFEAYIRQAEL